MDLDIVQAVYPMLFRLCPLTMRTQAILLVRDVVLLLEQLRGQGEWLKRTSVCVLTFHWYRGETK